MRQVISVVLLCLICSIGLCQNKPGPQTPSTINAGDVITVIVFGQPSYSGDFLVLEDGSINGRGFNRVFVTGKTVEQVQAELTKALAKTIRDPQVTVVFKTQLNSPIYVIGSLKQTPGPAPYVPDQTLREFILSVGIPADPDLLEANLYRKDGKIIPINLQELLHNDPDQWNGPMLPYDSLIILPRKYMRITFSPNSFAGATGKSGEQRIKAGIDVYAALAEIGGITNQGGFLLEELELVVKRGTKVFTFPAKQDPRAPNFPLQDGDTVLIVAPEQIKVYISGEVNTPGQYTLNSGGPVTQVVALAKGLTPEATLSNVTVVRGGDAFVVDDTPTLIGSGQKPFQLKNGDNIYVRRNERAVFALGEVKNPGRFLIPDARSWTATDLLAAAGGLSDKGTLRRVSLIRPDATGKYVATKFNLDEFLKDGKTQARPVLQSGDILLFGEPKGITLNNIGVLVSAALIISNLKLK